MADGRLAGKVALITGAGRGFGRAIALAFTREGTRVAANYLVSRAGAEEVVAEADRLGAEAIALRGDVAREDDVRALIAGTLDRFGRLDILVNSAALDPKFDPDAASKGIAPGSFEDYPLEQWNAALSVNLTGVFLVTQACVRQMIAQGKKGSIINICSTYGLNGPDQRIYIKDGQRVAFKPVYYTTTKAGVMGFTKYLAAYYAGTEIRVNALTPGGVYNNHEEYFVRNYSAKTILGRMAEKDEMNGALLFLASDASSYMTGTNVIVDGGWTAW
jgi:2-deoxy-D-gluconate 3-dehydrogenase